MLAPFFVGSCVPPGPESVARIPAVLRTMVQVGSSKYSRRGQRMTARHMPAPIVGAYDPVAPHSRVEKIDRPVARPAEMRR
jgi:hypothetical protein